MKGFYHYNNLPPPLKLNILVENRLLAVIKKVVTERNAVQVTS